MENIRKWLAMPPVRALAQALVGMLLGVLLAIPLVVDVLPPAVAACLAQERVLSALRSSPDLLTPSRAPTSLVSD